MKKRLQQYFPMIRTRQEVLDEIWQKQQLADIYSGWTPEQRESFLDFCTGVRGIKLLYDSFFKEIINPEYTPERLEDFLSLILRQKVTIKTILPGDSSRIADENSLLIMDILVELEDGRLVNVEVQKIGYLFPGARSACYSADLLLRQYKRIKSEKREHFNYKDVKGVYTIVLFERSPREFHGFPENYIHYGEQQFDTGLKMDLLQRYIFIPLDIFKQNLQNKGIRNDLDAWLTFLCEDEPGIIEQLIQQYPKFIPMYEDIYQLCRNMEKVMGLYSKELQMMDRNTVQFMIDEQEELIEKQREQLNRMDEELAQKSEQLSQKDEQLSQKDELLDQKEELLIEKDRKIEQLERLLAEKRK